MDGERTAPFDAAIVLGALVAPDGSPSPALARRVAHAVALARAGTVDCLLMTGGPVRHPRPEADLMRALAIEAGIEAGRVLVEDRSVNTIGNARLCRPIIERHGWSRLLLVTDAAHLPRALYIFHRFGLRPRPAAVWPDGWPGRDGWGVALRELAALPWSVIRVEWIRIRERYTL